MKKAKNISSSIIITGDTNIDMLEEKDQVSASRICRTMPIYRDILEENGMYVMNKKPTWFRGNKKSLIDHIATNKLITSSPPHVEYQIMVW